MSDEASRILLEQLAGRLELADDDLTLSFPMESFDELGYLRAYPDVAEAIARGDVKSGYMHFVRDGLREGRNPPGAMSEPRNRLIRFSNSKKSAAVGELTHYFESLVISRTGGVMIIGWADDSAAPIDYIRISCADWRLTFDGDSLARVRRMDVEEAIGKNVSHPFGYFGFIFADQPLSVIGELKVDICTKSGISETVRSVPRIVDDLELRNIVLGYLAGAQHFGNSQVKGIACVDKGLGFELLNHNRSITNGVIASPYVERFGTSNRKHIGSIIVCLYGRVEYLFVQNALFSGAPGMEDYEFIYVCNSPELAESLLREARIASQIYGIDMTVVILPGNAGFGAANNVAARVATTDRVLIVNPDVFPYDRDWARKHTQLLASRPKTETQLFGAPLYYDDGSLMHGGMYFDVDAGPSIEANSTYRWQLIRVEHYGKGAPAETAQFIKPRPVPAVTGAFISCDHAVFESLSGFTEDYIFGHYEDADLCLKAIQAGITPWLHDIRMWHLEGKGSTRLPVHDGGSLVNRWLFSARWGEMVSENLLGQTPSHPAFSPKKPDAVVAAKPVEPVVKPEIAVKLDLTAKTGKPANRMPKERARAAIMVEESLAVPAPIKSSTPPKTMSRGSMRRDGKTPA